MNLLNKILKTIGQKLYRFLFVPPENSPFLKKNQKQHYIGGQKMQDVAKAILLYDEIQKQNREK